MAKKQLKTGPGEFTASCVSCGTLVTEGQKFFSNGKNYCTNCAIISKKQEAALKTPAGAIKWLCYIVSFFSPFAGFALGIVFLSQGNQESRDFGRHCMIVMSVSLALILIFIIISAVMSIMSIGAEYAGPNIGEGYY